MTPLWKLYKYLPKRASTPMLRCRDEELELTPDKYKNNRSKSACTLNARKRLNNQAVWPVIFDITGPICARGLKTKIPLKEWEQDHLHGCRVCQSVYVYLNQRTTAPSENLESEDDAA